MDKIVSAQQLKNQKKKERPSEFKFSPRQMVHERKNPIEENYDILETIGKGGYGEVKKVYHRQLGVVRALKIINKTKYKDPAELRMVMNEI